MKENNVAELLIKLRKNKGYTQSDLADKLDISFQAVSKWERGENLPDAYTLLELANIYGITVDEILRGNIIQKESKQKIQKRKTILFMIAIALIVLSPISIFIYGVENYESYIIVILLITAISVTLMIYALTSSEKFATYTKVSRNQKRKEEIIYTICAGIFLFLGLAFNLFHIAWIVFIFGYAAALIVEK